MRQLTIAMFAFATVAAAQAPVTLSVDPFGYSGPQCHRNTVRDSAGTLFMASLDGTVAGSRPIVVYSSFDNGLTWFPFILSGINDTTTGLTGANPTTTVNLAIDDQDRLHFHWASHYYPSYFTNYYRSYDIATNTLSPVVDVKAITGVTLATRTTASQIAIGPDNTVWLTASMTSSWREQLLRSDVPYATTGTFTSVGSISVSASAQNTRMAIDAFGNIQCVYYENTGTGDYRHRQYDPMAAAWSAATNLGDLIAVNDTYGNVACDAIGNTHLLCLQDSGGAAGSNDPKLVYVVRDATGTMSAPITIMNATAAAFGSNNIYTLSMACNEATGECFVFYRDFTAGGKLTIARKGILDTAFAEFAVVRPPNSGTHNYYVPTANGTVWPMSNNCDGELHLTWREGTASPYAFRYARLKTLSPRVVFSDATIAPGTTVAVNFIATNHPSEVYIPAISCTPGPTPVPASPLVFPLLADLCFNYYFSNPFALSLFALGAPGSYFGMLDANGLAVGSVSIPATVPPGLNLPLHVAFVTAQAGLSVNDVSEAGTIVIN